MLFTLTMAQLKQVSFHLDPFQFHFICVNYSELKPLIFKPGFLINFHNKIHFVSSGTATKSVSFYYFLQMLPLTINIKDAYANGKDDEQKFIQNLSLFLCTFLKEHGQLVEKKV